MPLCARRFKLCRVVFCLLANKAHPPGAMWRATRGKKLRQPAASARALYNLSRKRGKPFRAFYAHGQFRANSCLHTSKKAAFRLSLFNQRKAAIPASTLTQESHRQYRASHRQMPRSAHVVAQCGPHGRKPAWKSNNMAVPKDHSRLTLQQGFIRGFQRRNQGQHRGMHPIQCFT